MYNHTYENTGKPSKGERVLINVKNPFEFLI